MNKFDGDPITAMRTVLEEICSHIPPGSISARTFIASRIVECANGGERTYDDLLNAAAARSSISSAA
jgi:hypothetical protein